MGKRHELINIEKQIGPKLYETEVYPGKEVEVVKGSNAFQGWRTHTEDSKGVLYIAGPP